MSLFWLNYLSIGMEFARDSKIVWLTKQAPSLQIGSRSDEKATPCHHRRLGLGGIGGAANATLTYTVWSGATVLDHAADFPVPTTDLIATFTDPGNPINFQDHAGPTSPNLFSSFFTAPSWPNLSRTEGMPAHR
jgi:hypothetical protein